MPSFVATVFVIDPEAFKREAFKRRNDVFASRVSITPNPNNPRLVTIESADYLSVEDVLIVDLDMSVDEAATYIDRS